MSKAPSSCSSYSCADSKVSLSLRTFLINFSKTKDYSEDSDASEQFGNIEDVLRLLRISNYETYTKSIKENNPRLKTAKDLLKVLYVFGCILSL
mmetsp:Transcript_430/g.611  ORF Transcript_430/g.611 Transcript_430/m.611 type:complete len:94 (-) Transcript_430:357-638(-)